MRAVIVPPASIRAISLSPPGDIGIGVRRRRVGRRTRGDVVGGDVALGEPQCVCRVQRGYERAARLDNVRIAADGVFPVHEIEDGVDAVSCERSEQCWRFPEK
jgi:hypothetical protein